MCRKARQGEWEELRKGEMVEIGMEEWIVLECKEKKDVMKETKDRWREGGSVRVKKGERDG